MCPIERGYQIRHVSILGECMMSVIKINNNITDPTCESRYQYCNVEENSVFDGCVKARESLYTQVIIWVNTSLNHFNTRTILPRYEGS